MNDEKRAGDDETLTVVIRGERSEFVRQASKSLGITNTRLINMCIDWSRENIRQFERDKRIEDLLADILNKNS